MITVTLTNQRHIAAATAAWIATIPTDPEQPRPYETVGDYVQGAIERVADSWVESTKVDQISVFAFVQRFTAAEFAAITTSADPNVASSVRLGSVDAVQSVGYLVSAGFLTAERGAEVLHYDLPQAP